MAASHAITARAGYFTSTSAHDDAIATSGCYTIIRTVHRQPRVGDLPLARLCLGGTDLNCKYRQLRFAFRSHFTRLQTLSHLLARKLSRARFRFAYRRRRRSLDVFFWREPRANFAARVVSFPFTPTAERAPQVFRAQFVEVVQQRNQTLHPMIFVLLPRPNNLLANTRDPYVAIVNVAECCLNSRRALCVG